MGVGGTRKRRPFLLPSKVFLLMIVGRGGRQEKGEMGVEIGEVVVEVHQVCGGKDAK